MAGIFDTGIFDHLSASAAQDVTAFTAQAGRVGVMAANALGVAVPLSGGTMTGTLVNNVSVKSKIFIDTDNEGFYLDPASNSILNTISANKVTVSTTVAGPFISLTQLGPTYGASPDSAAIIINSENPNQANQQITFKKAGTTNGYIDSDGYAYMRRFVDLDNIAYYLDPADTSYLNGLSCASGINSTSTNTNHTFAVKPYSKTMALKTSAQNVFTANDGVLAQGIYIFALDAVSNWTVGGGNYDMTYTGLFFWFQGDTNSVHAQQIYTTSMGHASNGNPILFRVVQAFGSTGTQAFQMWHSVTGASSYTYNFRFKRIM